MIENNQKGKVRQEFKLFSSKLAKFKNTKLKILCCGPANASGCSQVPGGTQQTSRSKMLLSVDENGIYRVHKLRALRLMADKNFSLKHSDFEGGEDPRKITNLKGATYQQLKDVKVIGDYVFCTLLTSSRLTFLEPEKIQHVGTLHWQLRDA